MLESQARGMRLQSSERVMLCIILMKITKFGHYKMGITLLMLDFSLAISAVDKKVIFFDFASPPIEI